MTLNKKGCRAVLTVLKKYCFKIGEYLTLQQTYLKAVFITYSFTISSRETASNLGV